MTSPIVIDASAAVEIIARTSVGAALQRLMPPRSVPWVPDGLFDAEVMSVLRWWDLRGTLPPDDVASAMLRFANWRVRRAIVSRLTLDAWTLRHNVTFTDACYVSLARRLSPTPPR